VLKIDIFCQVIDYFGDVAVAYRLARALQASDPSYRIRFFCTHVQIVHQLYPNRTNSIALYAFDSIPTESADVAIEAFACTLPTGYVLPRLIINLEYLTAESWIAEYHLQESIGMNQAGKKLFFFPSFTSSEGSLIHGDFVSLLPARTAHVSQHKRAITQELTLPQHFEERPWLLLYLYELEASCLADLCNSFAVIVVGLPDMAIQSKWLVQRRCSQDQFDTLITISDRLLIRGEDSLSRAMLGGRPFLWQAYRQEEAYHLVKLEALLDLFRPLADAATLEPWYHLQRELNRHNVFDVSTFASLPDASFRAMASQLQSYASLEEKLVECMNKHLS
jgi:hypothetical protein